MKAYQLKITIKESHPPIWRRVIVPAGLSFNQLTMILNEAMGWSGSHLSSYTFQRLGVDLQDAPDEDFSLLGSNELLDAGAVLIDDFLEAVGSFTYIYDFGDYWEHQVQIEDVIPDYAENYPQVLKYKGDTPWEDCGGIYAYYRMQEVLKDPKHPDYEEVRGWTAEPGASYDLQQVNAELSKHYLSKKTSGPMSLDELYNDWGQELPLKQIKPGKNAGRTADGSSGRAADSASGSAPFGRPQIRVVDSPKEQADSDAGRGGIWSDEDWDEEDEEFLDSEIPEDMQTMIDQVRDMTLVHVIGLLRKNLGLSPKKVREALDMPKDFYDNLMDLKKIMDRFDK